MPDWVEETACIVVKTYPVPAWNGVEVSCTAAITKDKRWLRLYPIPFRFLNKDQRFKRYQWIRARIKKANDARPESYNIDIDSISLESERLVSTQNKWAKRKDLVFPLLSNSYCELKERRDRDHHPTLGIFKPKHINRLVIENCEPNWSPEELAKLQQTDLFNEGPTNQLEKIPYKFSYEFTCSNKNCKGHKFMCTDWEMAQSYRTWRRKYGDAWEEKFRQRFEVEMQEKLDTHFYVGTVHQHPANWIIVGLFYPKL